MALWAPPASQVVDWTVGTSIGVRGGIPMHVAEVVPTGLTLDGTGDNTTAIQNAIVTAAGIGGVVRVKLPAGTIRCNSNLNWGVSVFHYSNVFLEGDGMGTTILKCYGSGNFIAAGEDAEGVAVEVTGGLAKGSTSITVTSATNISVGHCARIVVENEQNNSAILAGRIPVVHTRGYLKCRSQTVVVTNKVGNVLTVAPAIHDDYDAGGRLAVTIICKDYRPPSNWGVKNLTIDAEDSTAAFVFQISQSFDFFLENIEIKKARNYGVSIKDSCFFEMKGCYLNESTLGPGSNTAGLLTDRCSAIYAYNNRFKALTPCIEINFGTSGSVFSYNYCTPIHFLGLVWPNIFTNHGPHNHYNLYEGNAATAIQSDGYHGGESKLSLFRNQCQGVVDNGAGGYYARTPINFMRFTYSALAVGNVLSHPTVLPGSFTLGNAYIGGGTGNGNCNSFTGNFSWNWRATGTLTTRTSDTVGAITLSDSEIDIQTGQLSVTGGTNWEAGPAFEISTHTSTIVRTGDVIAFTLVSGVLPSASSTIYLWGGSDGWAQTDDGVAHTLIRKANYQFDVSGIPAGEALAGGETLPDSLYLTAQPSWWDSRCTYPPINPYAPSADVNLIPAAKVYFDGPDPSGSSTQRPRRRSGFGFGSGFGFI